MPRYQMGDGRVVDTAVAASTWNDVLDGGVSRITGRDDERQRLYRSRKGNFWIEKRGGRPGLYPHAEWISPAEAKAWLAKNQSPQADQDAAAVDETE